ncbi:MAG: hypothetical protein ABSG68_15245, partial [Thermoguttaceae bacterium]
MTTTREAIPRDILAAMEEIFAQAMLNAGDNFDDDTLEDEVARAFLENNYREARENLLSKTTKLRVVPL